jgi:dihydroorotase
MANTDPPADNAAIVQAVRDLATAAGSCDVFPVGAISHGLAGETLAEMGEMVDAGVRIFSDDGRSVPTARLLRNALTYAKAFPVEVVLAEHAEDASLVEGGQMHEGARSASLGLAGRPAEAEEVIVARDPRRRARLWRTGTPVPSVERASRRARSSAKAEGCGSRRGDAAPPRVHRRGPGDV